MQTTGLGGLGRGQLCGDVKALVAGGCGGGPAVIGFTAYRMFQVAYC